MLLSDSPANRRRFLGGAITAGALATVAPLLAEAAPTLDLTTAANRLRAFMLMRGALDERLTMSCIRCEYFGADNGQETPFYDLEAVTFARYRATKDGGYEAVTFEIEYFIDRDTGGVLDQWRNPYTGRTVTAKHVASPPMKSAIGADTEMKMPISTLYPGATFIKNSPVFDVIGGDVWLREKSQSSMPSGERKPTIYNELVTFHAKAADLAQPGATRIQADTEYLGISSFRPWQAMGDHPGHMVGYGYGAENLTLADLPPRWTAITRRLHPDALIKPEAYLAPLWDAS